MVDVKSFHPRHLSQPINLRAILKRRELLWGTWCHLGTESAARIMAMLPYDFCFIDAEHTPLGATEFAAVIRAIQFYSNGSMIPFARCTTPELVNHALNAGVGGIVWPHIQTKEEAERLVRLTKFPPRGDRSVPPYALVGIGKETTDGKSSLDVWDDHVAIFCQIEDVTGVKNVEEIASVPGIDGLMVGGYDLQTSLGLKPIPVSAHDPQFLTSIRKIQDTADRNGLVVLGGCFEETLADRLKLGWRLLLCQPDVYHIIKGGTESVELYKLIAKKNMVK